MSRLRDLDAGAWRGREPGLLPPDRVATAAELTPAGLPGVQGAFRATVVPNESGKSRKVMLAGTDPVGISKTR